MTALSPYSKPEIVGATFSFSVFGAEDIFGQESIGDTYWNSLLGTVLGMYPHKAQVERVINEIKIEDKLIQGSDYSAVQVPLMKIEELANEYLRRVAYMHKDATFKSRPERAITEFKRLMTVIGDRSGKVWERTVMLILANYRNALLSSNPAEVSQAAGVLSLMIGEISNRNYTRVMTINTPGYQAGLQKANALIEKLRKRAISLQDVIIPLVRPKDIIQTSYATQGAPGQVINVAAGTEPVAAMGKKLILPVALGVGALMVIRKLKKRKKKRK